MSRSPNLAWLRTFDAAARHLNFTAAGREVSLTQTAVSQHVRALEGRLGCQLFIRHARTVELTDMGRAYAHSVRKSLADIDLATAALFGTTSRKVLTMRAPISLASLWLAPRLARFRADYPEIPIRLVSTLWAESISEEDVDLDVRMGFGTWPGLRAERIASDTVSPVAAVTTPDLDVSELLARPLIHIVDHEEMWDRWLAHHGRAGEAVRYAYFVDTSVAAMNLVASGAGIATMLTRFAMRDSRVRLIGEPAPCDQGHYLVNYSASRPEVALLRDWLIAEFEADG